MQPGQFTRAVPSGCDAGPAVAGGTGPRLASPVPGDAALSGRASWPPGDQSRVAAARVGGTHVTDTVLGCVQEIRAALGDAADAPHYLATVGRQGYRFLVGDDREVAPRCWPDPSWDANAKSTAWRRGSSVRPKAPARSCLSVAKPGWARRRWWSSGWPAWPPEGGRIARGQCVEHFGEGEPYLPLLEALGQLSRGRITGRCWTHCSGMRRCGSSNGRGCCPKRSCSASNASSRATRPGCSASSAEVLDALTAETPLVLFLEDLHWSDLHRGVSELCVAQRRVPAAAGAGDLSPGGGRG